MKIIKLFLLISLLGICVSEVFSKDVSINNEIILPNEKGEEEVFELIPVPLFSKSLVLKYPNIKTYKGFSKNRPEVKVRITITPDWISAWLQFENKPDFFIQPVKGEKRLHFSYQKTNINLSNPLVCKTKTKLECIISVFLARKGVLETGNNIKLC